MRQLRENGKTAGGPTRRCVWALALCAVALLLGALEGCKGPSETRTAGDPLVGEKPPDKTYGVAGPTPPPQNRAGMQAPPTPTATASKSNAAMLIPDALPGAKESLIMTEVPKQPVTGQPTGNWQPKPGATRNGVPDSIPGNNAPVAVGLALQPVPISPPGGVILPELQQKLKDHGVSYQGQTAMPDGIRYTFAVPNPQNPNFSRLYEVIAADVNDAARDVLDKMDKR
jgi:hypothetical protein